jgi:hypothetical protein
MKRQNSLLLFLICTLLYAHPAFTEKETRWKPVKDAVYLQETGSQLPSEEPLIAAALLENTPYLASEKHIFILQNSALKPLENAPEGSIRRLEAIGGRLWLCTENALHSMDAGGAWREIAAGRFQDLSRWRDTVAAASGRQLYQVKDGGLEELGGKAPGEIVAIEWHAESLYVLTREGLAVFTGRDYDSRKIIEWGELPAAECRGMLSHGSRLLFATARGVAVLRGTAVTLITGRDGLPYEDIRALAPGFGGDWWAATEIGAVRATSGEYHYFGGRRWLPGDQVNAIACAENAVYLATDAGAAIIKYEPWTLRKKADYYEKHLRAWNQKRMAFTHKLEWNPEKGGWVREISDNDVGWSTHYWAAQTFRYAVTGGEEARRNAIEGFNALKWVEEITPIDGFPARSIWAEGETGNRTTGGSGGYPAEWNPLPDSPWVWKGDTSSDEIDAHYYYASIFYELAADAALKEQVRDHLRRMSDHIIEHGWTMVDLDGKPTVWCRWDPEYFAGKGRAARGLNGLEVLTYMRTAAAITGDDKYIAALNELLDMNYTERVIEQKLTFGPSIFHSDDRLAFYCYHTVLRHETDPWLRGIYRRSLERSWEIERMEHIPWFSFIYGALTGNDCETGRAVRHLRETPLDLVNYSFSNEKRADLFTPEGYESYCRVVKAFSPRVIGLRRWSSQTGPEAGGGGKSVTDPSGWIEAYWMGRYYGMILPPETDDPALITAPEIPGQPGAVPYDGPPMPDVLEE